MPVWMKMLWEQVPRSRMMPMRLVVLASQACALKKNLEGARKLPERWNYNLGSMGMPFQKCRKQMSWTARTEGGTLQGGISQRSICQTRHGDNV